MWDVKWSDDNPDLFAIMEKIRTYVIRNSDPEEPITSTGYLCDFQQLQLRIAFLDEILERPEDPQKEHLCTLDTKSLRDTQSR